MLPPRLARLLCTPCPSLRNSVVNGLLRLVTRTTENTSNRAPTGPRECGFGERSSVVHLIQVRRCARYDLRESAVTSYFWLRDHSPSPAPESFQQDSQRDVAHRSRPRWEAVHLPQADAIGEYPGIRDRSCDSGEPQRCLALCTKYSAMQPHLSFRHHPCLVNLIPAFSRKGETHI
ncbi:hypothetical protein BD410DRAFT_194472 [Rickenella mellea]|uniref:Uncharacterized protein n=1 Tax=Rickenella mellea TaxID=50990 RepID=A0A4Y7Q797_9AGAM|nr:hypothetical protein BD410DRAFT_194472 [Rickenella mellea]